MMIDDIRQVLRTYHKFIPESRLKLFMMKRDFLTIGSMWSLGQVSVGVLCWFFLFSLSLLDPILLVTNHKERIDVWLYKPSHHSVQSWAGRSAQYKSITCVRNEVSSSLPFLQQQQQLYIFRAIVMDQLEKLPDVPLAPLLPPPLPLPLPRLSKCCCMYVYII